MKATRADAEQKQQMMRILKRLHEQGGLEDQQQHRPDGSSSSSSEAGSEEGSEAGSEDEEGPAAAAAAGLDKWLAQSPEFQQLLQRVSSSQAVLSKHVHEASSWLFAASMHTQMHALCCPEPC